MKDLNEAFKKTLDFFENPVLKDDKGEVVDLQLDKTIVMRVSENVEKITLKDGRVAMVKIIISAEHKDVMGYDADEEAPSDLVDPVGLQKITLFKPDILAEA